MSGQTSPDLVQKIKEELVEQYHEQYPDDTTENILQDSASDNDSDSSWYNDKTIWHDDIQPTIRNLQTIESE